MPTRDEVIEIAKKCFDPEIPVNIWDLGLIYDIDAKDTSVSVRMSLTSKMCPSAQQIPNELKGRILDAFDIEDVKVDVVYEPEWTAERISAEGKKKLGLA